MVPDVLPDDGEAVDLPGWAVRLACMTRSLSEPIERLQLDADGFHRSAMVFKETVDALRELLSDELQEELARAPQRGQEPARTVYRDAGHYLCPWSVQRRGVGDGW